MVYIINKNSKRKKNSRKDKRNCVHYNDKNKMCKYLNKVCPGATKCLAYYSYK